MKTEKYYDKELTIFQASADPNDVLQVYAEFANMLRETTVYRDGAMMSVDDWINAQTNEVMMLAVFSIPFNSITTVMRLTWTKDEVDGSGRYSGRVSIRSYKTIDPGSLDMFLYLIYFNVFLNIADLLNLLRVVLKRRQKKQRYMTTCDTKYADDKKKLDNMKNIVKKNLPVVEKNRLLRHRHANRNDCHVAELQIFEELSAGWVVLPRTVERTRSRYVLVGVNGLAQPRHQHAG
jgi:hypothetical protein